jgi:hypothetical protein
LPTLNNLLENREMALDDGSFLVAAARYDALLATNDEASMKKKQLLRVHPDFRVIALGLPVPRFPGYPLDPPLRSRFQARSVGSPAFNDTVDELAAAFKSVPLNVIKNLVGFRETLAIIEAESKIVQRIPHFSEIGLHHLVHVLSLFPHTMAPALLNKSLIERVYPYSLVCDLTQRETVQACMDKFSIKLTAPELTVKAVRPCSASERVFEVEFTDGSTVTGAAGTYFAHNLIAVIVTNIMKTNVTISVIIYRLRAAVPPGAPEQGSSLHLHRFLNN